MFESLIIGSVRNDKSNVYDNTTNEWFDWLNEAHFWCNFWHSMPEDALKFSFLRFWPQHKPLALNLSFFASCMKISFCQGSERQLRLLCTMWPRWHNQKTLYLNQSSILILHFHCFCDFFKLLFTLWKKKDYHQPQTK